MSPKSGSKNNDLDFYWMKMIKVQHKKNFHPTMWENSGFDLDFVCIIGGHRRNGHRDTRDRGIDRTDLD